MEQVSANLRGNQSEYWQSRNPFLPVAFVPLANPMASLGFLWKIFFFFFVYIVCSICSTGEAFIGGPSPNTPNGVSFAIILEF
jgi:hypothetical protein